MATRRPRRIDGRVFEAIGELRSKGWTNAAEIERELDRRSAQQPSPFPAGAVPNLRTIQRVLRDLTPRDATEWRIADADDEEAALILPVIAAMIEESEGRRKKITRAEARWILKIRRADLAGAGERLDDLTVYELAFDAASISSDPPHVIDPELERYSAGIHAYLEQFLAFGPWRSSEHEARYYSAFEKGWLGWRFMAYPRFYFTNEGWPKPLSVGYVRRELDKIDRQHAPKTVEEDKPRDKKTTR